MHVVCCRFNVDYGQAGVLHFAVYVHAQRLDGGCAAAVRGLAMAEVRGQGAPHCWNRPPRSRSVAGAHYEPVPALILVHCPTRRMHSSSTNRHLYRAVCGHVGVLQSAVEPKALPLPRYENLPSAGRPSCMSAVRSGSPSRCDGHPGLPWRTRYTYRRCVAGSCATSCQIAGAQGPSGMNM